MSCLIRNIVCTVLLLGPSVSVAQDVSWDEVYGVRLEALPEISGKPLPAKQTEQLGIVPKRTQPDFGPMPELPGYSSANSMIAERNWDVPTGSPEYRKSVPGVIVNSSGRITNASSIAGVRFAPTGRAAPATGLAVKLVKSTPVIESVVKTGKTTSSSKPVSLRPKVRLDAKLLAKKIGDFNLAVAGIDNHLVAQDEWDLVALESAFSRLRTLKRDREVWALNRNAVPQSRRRWIAEPVSLNSSLTHFQQRVFETRIAAETDSATISLLQLTELQQRLADMRSTTADWLADER